MCMVSCCSVCCILVNWIRRWTQIEMIFGKIDAFFYQETYDLMLGHLSFKVLRVIDEHYYIQDYKMIIYHSSFIPRQKYIYKGKLPLTNLLITMRYSSYRKGWINASFPLFMCFQWICSLIYCKGNQWLPWLHFKIITINWWTSTYFVCFNPI